MTRTFFFNHVFCCGRKGSVETTRWMGRIAKKYFNKESHMTIPHEPTLPMPPVMSHEEWMTMTKVSWKVRGSRLRELDSAIRNFHVAKTERALVKVAEALLEWIDQSHPNGDFLQSKRNSNQAVGLLLPVLSWFFSDPKRREISRL